jgi:hypothetical protein
VLFQIRRNAQTFNPLATSLLEILGCPNSGLIPPAIQQRPNGQPLGQSPRDESKGNMPIDECASNYLGDGTTKTGTPDDVERQNDTLGKVDCAWIG